MGVKKPSKKSSLTRRQFWIKTVLQNGRYQSLPLITGNGPDDLPMIDPDWQELPGIPHDPYLLRRIIDALVKRISFKSTVDAEWVRRRLWVHAGTERAFQQWDPERASGLDWLIREKQNELIKALLSRKINQKVLEHDPEVLRIQHLELRSALSKYPAKTHKASAWLRANLAGIIERLQDLPCWCTYDKDGAEELSKYADLNNWQAYTAVQLSQKIMERIHRNAKKLPTTWRNIEKLIKDNTTYTA